MRSLSLDTVNRGFEDRSLGAHHRFRQGRTYASQSLVEHSPGEIVKRNARFRCVGLKVRNGA